MTSAEDEAQGLGDCSAAVGPANDGDAGADGDAGFWWYVVVGLAAVISLGCLASACRWRRGRRQTASFGAVGIAMADLAQRPSPANADGELYGSAGAGAGAGQHLADAEYEEVAEITADYEEIAETPAGDNVASKAAERTEQMLNTYAHDTAGFSGEEATYELEPGWCTAMHSTTHALATARTLSHTRTQNVA